MSKFEQEPSGEENLDSKIEELAERGVSFSANWDEKGKIGVNVGLPKKYYGKNEFDENILRECAKYVYKKELMKDPARWSIESVDKDDPEWITKTIDQLNIEIYPYFSKFDYEEK